MDPLSAFLLFWGGVLLYSILYGVGISWAIRRFGAVLRKFHWILLGGSFLGIVLGSILSVWLMGWLFGAVSVSSIVLDSVVEFMAMMVTILLLNPQKV